MERKKVLGFWDLLLFSFCAIFGVEAIATSAAIGPSAVSWWLICIVGYFLPFGLITAELGAAYPEQGGIYVWIKRAFGNKWAARTTWYYWVAVPLWLPAIYIAFAEIAGHMFFPGMGLWAQVLIGIIIIWIAVGINICPLESSKWVPNIGSATKLVVIIGMIAVAVMSLLKNGRFANEINIRNIMPNLNAAVVFIPVILYNLLGCELISAAAGEMKDPARDVPKAVIMSALAIASLYLITTFAVWAVIPISEINISSGAIQIFKVALSGGGIGQIIMIIIGLNVLITLFTGTVAWTLSENRTVAEAANGGELPAVFGKMTRKYMTPLGASIISGVISTIVVVIYGFIARNASELFWHIVSFSGIVGLLSYLILFPAFIVLRIKDKNIKRPYRIPGPDWFAVFLAVMSEVFIFITAIIWTIQPGHEFTRVALPIIIGIIITVAIGEICVNHSAKKGRSPA